MLTLLTAEVTMYVLEQMHSERWLYVRTYVTFPNVLLLKTAIRVFFVLNGTKKVSPKNSLN